MLFDERALPEIARKSREAWDKRSEDAARGTGGLEMLRALSWFGFGEAGGEE